MTDNGRSPAILIDGLSIQIFLILATDVKIRKHLQKSSIFSLASLPGPSFFLKIFTE